MKAIVYALLVITMAATVSADSGTPLWAGVWKCDYNGICVYLVINNDLSGYVSPDPQGASVATLEYGKVSADGTTYTARWIERSSSEPGDGDIADFKLTRSKPTEFTGIIMWPDGSWLPFNGKWYSALVP